jgi:hypothetical protein
MKILVLGFLLFVTQTVFAQIDITKEAGVIRKLRLANNQSMANHDLLRSLSIMTNDYVITGGDGSAAFEKDSIYNYFADDTAIIYER